MAQVILFLSLVLGVVSTALEAVGLAIPYWTVVGDSFHLGLWKYCAEAGKASGCIDVPSDYLSDERKATGVLSAIATVLMAIALLLLFLKACVKRDAKLLTTAGAFVFFLAGVLAIAGVGVYGKKYSDNFGSGFIMCTLAGCLSIINGLLLLCARIREGAHGYNEI